MDSRKDEQERGITMKSSAVSLIHEHQKGFRNTSIQHIPNISLIILLNF
jgi:translation elongation factor EF-G